MTESPSFRNLASSLASLSPFCFLKDRPRMPCHNPSRSVSPLFSSVINCTTILAPEDCCPKPTKFLRSVAGLTFLPPRDPSSTVPTLTQIQPVFIPSSFSPLSGDAPAALSMRVLRAFLLILSLSSFLPSRPSANGESLYSVRSQRHSRSAEIFRCFSLRAEPRIMSRFAPRAGGGSKCLRSMTDR